MKPHEILGVAPDATPEAIARAYRVLAAKFHPDKPTGDDEKFRAVQDAYDTVCGRGPKSHEEMEADRHFRAILGSMLLDYAMGGNMIEQALSDIEEARSRAASIIHKTTQSLIRVRQVAARISHPMMVEVSDATMLGLTNDIERERERIAVLMMVRSRVMQIQDGGAAARLGQWSIERM